MRLLIVAPYPLYPTLAGGKIRVRQLAQLLVERGATVNTIAPFKPNSAAPSQAAGALAQIPYPFLFHHLLTDRPLPYQHLISLHPGYRRLAESYLRNADIIQFEHASFADLMSSVPSGVPIIYDAHNVEYEYVTSECRSTLVRNLVGRRIFRLERALVERADRIVTCSEEDGSRLLSLYGAAPSKFAVVPNGIERTHVATDGTEVSRQFPALAKYPVRALFAGSDVAHNRVAVDYLVHDLAPRVSARTAILIRGGCGRHLDKTPANVFVAPEGTAIAAYAPLCNVAVHPVLQGGGTSLKLLDYLMHGLPVIATEFGMRGYPDLRPFVILRPPEGFAEALAEVPPFDPQIRTVLERYLWSRGADRLMDLYQDVLQRR